MLPVPNLDDRLFEEIVGDARKMIPKLFPQWTDENAHDPGITMMELFSWLAEMQQYYLNRVTRKNELKFLKLLGVQLRPAACARTDVTFDRIGSHLRLPPGMKLEANDLTFETEEGLWLLPARIERVLVQTDADAYDFTSANGNGKVTYFAFGAEARKGNRLLVGFDQELPSGRPFALTVRLYEGYPIPMGPLTEEHGDVCHPSARVVWSYFGEAGWQEIEPLQDETAHLSRSGRITFTLPAAMRETTVHPATDLPRYWLRCTVEQAGYELPPKVEVIELNTISAVHRDTQSETFSFDSEGTAEQTFTVEHALAFFEEVEVQVRAGEDGTWRSWAFDAEREAEAAVTKIRCLETPPAGADTVRVIAFTGEFAADRWIGRSNGLPKQRFLLPFQQVLPETMLLQVGVRDPFTGEQLWEDWTCVEDFDRSEAEDRHFLYLPETGEIVFGDNEAGLIPESDEEPNLRLIRLALGGGVRGNVQKGLIRAVEADDAPYATLGVHNRDHAYGGAERETLEEAKARIRRDLKQSHRAVADADFERIAKRTPGLRVARAKAIPHYRVGMREGSPAADNVVTVVAVPYNEEKKPLPSPGFLQTVQEYVDRHRLLTTEVEVVPPVYVAVTVQASVVVDPARQAQARAQIQEALHRCLDPLNDEDHSTGWAFGQPVYRADVYSVIHGLPGVEYIQDLRLEASGPGSYVDASGDVRLPLHGLVYSGEHRIEWILLDSRS
ncbi:putative baseplate assembly protein [Tumebacillus sp. DT12]|uniref:Baseplate assembly protein n=1 Tax=Tumebacillus lacus TaxID=2995335 RepID=A0ABT3X2T5_9BACL|nr:putative baseplate assembly protein [Tumebacillus lacus]MCX7570278.1 putative baseplate assembly protein [Tumebacillus lacus]